MSQEMVISLARDALSLVLLLSAPALGLGLIVGLAISILQATTQIQEQTLTFVPKIIAVFVGLLIFGKWMLTLLVGYASNIFGNLTNLVH